MTKYTPASEVFPIIFIRALIEKRVEIIIELAIFFITFDSDLIP